MPFETVNIEISKLPSSAALPAPSWSAPHHVVLFPSARFILVLATAATRKRFTPWAHTRLSFRSAHSSGR